MNITRTQKAVALSALVVGIFLFYTCWPSGPSHAGKSIGKWFYGSSKDDAEGFRAMGQDAVPFLIERLQDAPSDRLQGFLGMLSRAPKEIYHQRKVMWQARAAHLLGEIGPAAESAAPYLTNAVATGDWSLRGSATVALLKIKQQPPDPLIEKLNDTSDSKAWYENAIMVGQFGARAEPAIPILLHSLQHSNNVIQAHALIALGMIARQPEKCIPAILPFMTSANVSDRQKALWALLSFGTNAVSAKQAIQAALTDPDAFIRGQAKQGLKALK